MASREESDTPNRHQYQSSGSKHTWLQSHYKGNNKRRTLWIRKPSGPEEKHLGHLRLWKKQNEKKEQKTWERNVLVSLQNNGLWCSRKQNQNHVTSQMTVMVTYLTCVTISLKTSAVLRKLTLFLFKFFFVKCIYDSCELQRFDFHCFIYFHAFKYKPVVHK